MVPKANVLTARIACPSVKDRCVSSVVKEMIFPTCLPRKLSVRARNRYMSPFKSQSTSSSERQKVWGSFRRPSDMLQAVKGDPTRGRIPPSKQKTRKNQLKLKVTINYACA